MGLLAGQEIEGKGEQRIACENCGGFVERLMRRRPSAPKRVIVHRRQIVMDQRIGVHAFQRCRRHRSVFRLYVEQLRRLDHKEWPYAFAS